MNLNTCRSGVVGNFGHNLFTTSRFTMRSFEHVAQTTVEAVFRQFKDDDGQPAFALVRVFRAGIYDDLSPELQALADPSNPYWLALYGTTGIQDAWCDRRRSQNHQVVPGGDNMPPMLEAVFSHAMQQDVIDTANIHPVRRNDTAITQSYFVPHALGSPYVPAQEQFVIPYGIQSLLGLGSSFTSGTAYVLLGFSCQALNEDAALRFAELAPYLSSLMATYEDRGVLWG